MSMRWLACTEASRRRRRWPGPVPVNVSRCRFLTPARSPPRSRWQKPTPPVELIDYQKTVLAAFRDVETAIAAYQADESKLIASLVGSGRTPTRSRSIAPPISIKTGSAISFPCLITSARSTPLRTLARKASWRNHCRRLPCTKRSAAAGNHSPTPSPRNTTLDRKRRAVSPSKIGTPPAPFPVAIARWFRAFGTSDLDILRRLWRRNHRD